MDLRPEKSRHAGFLGTLGQRLRGNPRGVVEQLIEGVGHEVTQTRDNPPRAKMSGHEGFSGRPGHVRVDFGGRAGDFDFDRRRLLAHQPAGHPLDTHRNMVRAEGVLHGAEGPVAAPGHAAGIEADFDLALGRTVVHLAGPEERLALALMGLDLANQLRDPVGGLRAVNLFSTTHHRCQGAATKAEDLLDSVLSGRVGIVLAGDLEIITQHIVDALGTFDVTGSPVADANQIPPHGTVPELRVESRDADDLRQGHVALVRHPAQRLGRQVTVTTLQGLQDGQNPVWITPQTVERLINKGEVEFHDPDLHRPRKHSPPVDSAHPCRPDVSVASRSCTPLTL